MTLHDTNQAATVALRALAWTLGDPARAARFLALTGLRPDALRAGALDPATLAEALRFLEAHEPDLVACAEAIGATPADLPEARRRLEA
jgi:hypothetical protein